jgi:hypothetical protein
LKEILDISATLQVKRTNLAIKHAKQFQYNGDIRTAIDHYSKEKLTKYSEINKYRIKIYDYSVRT